MNKKIRLQILYKLPTPYSDLLFQALNRHYLVDLHVHHLWAGGSARPWKTELGLGYPNRYMKMFLGIDWHFMWLSFQEKESFFVIGDWGHLPSLALIFLRIMMGYPVSIWTDTPQEDAYRPPLKRWFRSKLLYWLLSRTDVLFATGKPGMRVVEAMGANRDAIVNLPFIADLEKPNLVRDSFEHCSLATKYRNQMKCDDNSIVFIMSGSLIPRKGFDIGLKAFARCKAQVATRIGLLIAGEGSERSYLEQLAEQLGITENVMFLGWQEPTEMEAVYLAGDILMHPALQDPFPNVVLEAMAWGKVVIGSHVCGSIEDRVRQGVNGFSFPSGDVNALATIMIDLISNPHKIRDIGRAARATANEWPIERGVDIILSSAQQTLEKHFSLQCKS